VTTTSDRPAGSTLRTLPRRLAGRALARTLRLPAPTTSYTVSSVKIPMRDGVELIADVYEPVGEAVGIGDRPTACGDRLGTSGRDGLGATCIPDVEE